MLGRGGEISGVGGAGGIEKPLDPAEPFALPRYVPAHVAEILAEIVNPFPENPPEKQG